MRKLITLSLLLFSLALQSQEELKHSTYRSLIGVWQSQDGEVVKIEPSGRFTRIANKEVQAKGIVELKDNQLYIKRTDSNNTYSLCFFTGPSTMVVCKPKSTEAWLFHKVREL